MSVDAIIEELHKLSDAELLRVSEFITSILAERRAKKAPQVEPRDNERPE